MAISRKLWVISRCVNEFRLLLQSVLVISLSASVVFQQEDGCRELPQGMWSGVAFLQQPLQRPGLVMGLQPSLL